MVDELDVRGLSCPQPLYKVEKEMKKLKKGEFVVLSDCGTSRANILRLAKQKGWDAEETSEDRCDFVITLTKE